MAGGQYQASRRDAQPVSERDCSKGLGDISPTSRMDLPPLAGGPFLQSGSHFALLAGFPKRPVAIAVTTPYPCTSRESRVEFSEQICDVSHHFPVYMCEGPYRKGKEVHVEDKQIIDLYWARSETAISETADKYGRYCHSIAFNILRSHEDIQIKLLIFAVISFHRLMEQRTDSVLLLVARHTVPRSNPGRPGSA